MSDNYLTQNVLAFASLIIAFTSLLITYIYNRKLYKMSIVVHKNNMNQQKTEYIQQRLEKLYYPLKAVLDNYHDISVKNIMNMGYNSKIKDEMREIEPYLYLSSVSLSAPLNRFVSIFDKNVISIENQYRKDLKALKNNTSEGDVKNIETLEFVLDEHRNSIRREILLAPHKIEAEEAINLYSQILDILEEDISNYKRQIEEFTI